MDSMFKNAISFDQDLSHWQVTSLRYAEKMFDGMALSVQNYDALLIGWDTQNLQTNVTFSGGNSHYCLGASARTDIISSKQWVITDAANYVHHQNVQN
jgi:hypothetical protein